MRAMVLYGHRDVRIEEISKPTPGYGEVLAKVNCVGLCATDVAIYTGKNSFEEKGLIKYPMIQGHEWSGTVVEVGKGVTQVAIGDRVIGDCAVTCGNCKECISGNYIQCEHQRSVGTVNAWNGAMEEYILMPQRSVYKIPDELSFEEAALVEPLAIGFYAVERAEIGIGDTVVVYGTGTIGFGALIAAVNSSAASVIFVGRKRKKLKMGQDFGATHCINIMEVDAKAEIMKLTKGKGAEVVIDATGSPEVLKTCMGLVKNSGKLSMPAFYDTKIDNFDIDDIVLRNLKVIGVSGSPNLSLKVMNIIKEKKIEVSKLITARFKLEELAAAYYQASNDRDNIKIMLNIE